MRLASIGFIESPNRQMVAYRVELLSDCTMHAAAARFHLCCCMHALGLQHQLYREAKPADQGLMCGAALNSACGSAARLFVLLHAVPSLRESVLEFSSLNSGPERAATLAAFRGGDARILVASDGMTRGMDVPSVANVVNYDAPIYAKTYVHRAGRTARGGREGGIKCLLCQSFCARHDAQHQHTPAERFAFPHMSASMASLLLSRCSLRGTGPDFPESERA